MNVLFTLRTYVPFLSLALCATSLNLFSVDQKTAKITESEMHMILEEKQNSYVCLSEELSKLAYVIEKLSLLDVNKNSIIHQFKKHIDSDASIALYDEVLEALLYGEALLNKHRNAFEEDKKDLFVAFDAVMTELLNGELSFEKTADGFLRSAQLRLLVVDENMVVLGKVKFKEDVKFEDDVTFKKHIKTKQGIHIEGKLVVDKKAVFERNVIIEGTLSVADVVIASCIDNLCVNTLSVTDLAVASCIDSLCVNNLSVTDLAVASCMDSLCVNTLSAVDVSISGTLSANDAIITTATIDNLVIISPTIFTDITISGTASITDAIIVNATVTNLSATDVITTNLQVTNCVPNLCVTTLSVQDEVLNGTLKLTALTPAGVVHNSATGVLSSSLIVNADVAAGAGIVDTKLATISTAGKVANSATTATSVNTPNTIVLRDGAGNFAAGTITAALNGNATTATTATNFSGALAGEVTGTQGATVVTNAVSANTANAIVRRTATGGFSAGTISVTDDVVNGNLILTTNPSTSTAGNILKGANRFIHNFGTQNTFVGQNAGNFTLSGVGNVGVGDSALTALTTGNQNAALGLTALASNTTGASNTAIGFRAMGFNTIGLANTGVGQNALLNNIDGIENTSIGAHSLETNTSGNINVAVGFNALTANTTGVQNTACGCNTLEQLTTGINNTAIGKFAGQNASGASSNNIYINNLGTAESGIIRIGNNTDQTACFIAGISGVTTGLGGAVAVLIDSAGQLGTISSSAQFKRDIQDMNLDSADVLNLRPVTFIYKTDETNTRQYGLIAEEVDKAFPALAVYDAEGQPKTVQYHVLPVLLLNEMKKQHSTIEKMNDAMASLYEQVQEFIGRVKTLENQA